MVLVITSYSAALTNVLTLLCSESKENMKHCRKAETLSAITEVVNEKELFAVLVIGASKVKE